MIDKNDSEDEIRSAKNATSKKEPLITGTLIQMEDLSD